MEKRSERTKTVALIGLMIALSFTLSWLEHFLPLDLGVPGIKPGLANIVVVAALYTLPVQKALPVALVRIMLAGLTFGNAFSLLYSLAGGLLSFSVMLLLKKTRLSPAGVSVAGGVSHNLGQFAVAAAVLKTRGLLYYLPVLLLAGLVAGLLVGLIASPVIKRLQSAGFGTSM